MIRLLDNNDKEAALEYANRNELEAPFYYANVTNFGLENDMKTRRCGDYFGFFEGDELRGILPFYNLGSCIPHYESCEAIPLFVQLMKERKFQYLMGMEKIIKPIYDLVKDSKNITKCNDSSFFINRSFKPFTIDGLELVDAKEAVKADKGADFLVRMRNVGFDENVSREEAIDSLGDDPEEDAVIALVNGEFVAFAKIQAYTTATSQLGSVYTEEAYRGKGYCKAVVSEICSRIVARGKTPTLFARKNNTPAVNAYSAVGFKCFDDYLFIELGE